MNQVIKKAVYYVGDRKFTSKRKAMEYKAREDYILDVTRKCSPEDLPLLTAIATLTTVLVKKYPVAFSNLESRLRDASRAKEE